MTINNSLQLQKPAHLRPQRRLVLYSQSVDSVSKGHIVIYHTDLSSSSIEHSVDEGHDGSLQVDLISVAASTLVKLIQQRLRGQDKLWSLSANMFDVKYITVLISSNTHWDREEKTLSKL